MNIAFFSAVRYDSVIGGRTRRLCDELSRRHSVHFVEMPSLRYPCFNRKTRISDQVSSYQLMPLPGLWKIYDSICGQCWVAQAAGFLNRHLPSDTHVVVSTPFWTPVLKKLKVQSITYDCLDHLSVQTPGNLKPAARLEQDLLAMADHVICVSENLVDELKKRTSKNVVTVSNGFPEEYLLELVTYPAEPVAGFCGAMFEWFDFSMIRDVVKALKDVYFILTGPVRNAKDLRPLYCLSNVEINPAIPFSKVKSEILRYSVGMIPFKRDIISYFCDPIKMYEYAALGRHVVSTVQGTRSLPVYFTKNTREFVAGLDRIVHSPSAIKIDRIELGKYTWGKIAEKLERILE